MQQQARRGRAFAEQREPREDAFVHQVARELLPDAPGPALELRRFAGLPGAGQQRRHPLQRVDAQGRGPAAHEPVAHGRVGGLERIVPVAQAVGG